LLAEIHSLELFPGRNAEVETEDPGATPIRRMPVPPFRIFYELAYSQRTVRIVAVQHGAQRG